MKIKISGLILIMVMLPFVEPRIFSELPFFVDLGVHTIYTYLKYLSFFLILIFRLRYKDFSVSRFLKVLIIYFSALVFSTYIGSGDMRTVLMYAAESIGLCLLAETYIRKYGISEYCFYVSRILIFLVLINCITIFIWPAGLYEMKLIGMNRMQNWFLGYKNSHVYIYLPCIFFCFLYSIYSKDKIKTSNKLFLIIIFAALLISESTTSIILIVVFGFYCIYSFNKRKSGVFKNPKVHFGVFIIFNVALIFGDVLSKFAPFIEKASGKNSTLQSRIDIWNRALKYLYESPILGVGVEEYKVALEHVYGQAHNKLLDITYTGGIVGLILFVMLLLLVIKRFSDNKNSTTTNIGCSILICYYILFFTEAQRSNPLFFLVLFICYIITNPAKNDIRKQDTKAKSK